MRKSLLLVMVLASTDVAAAGCAILLHGLARSSHSFSAMEQALTDAGYAVVNYDYPSTRYEVEKLARDAVPVAMRQCPERGPIHFVTHSLGGILVRQYLRLNNVENLGRVVMLGPPNQGSEVVDRLYAVPGFALINGPAGNQLGTHSASLPNALGPADFEVGIIAGTRSINPILSALMPRPNDGKVSVENTKLAGMKDHIVLPVTHTFMMNNRTVINQVMHFLRYGVFAR